MGERMKIRDGIVVPDDYPDDDEDEADETKDHGGEEMTDEKGKEDEQCLMDGPSTNCLHYRCC